MSTAIELDPCASCHSNIRPLKSRAIIEGAEMETEISVYDNAPNNLEQSIIAKVYPNPSNTEITIQSEDNITKSEIYDLNGKLILQTLDRVINISDFQNGPYVVKVYVGEKFTTKQFVKF